MDKYIAKTGVWFKPNSEAYLIDYLYTTSDGIEVGLFKGTYIVGVTGYDKFWYKKGFSVNDEVIMTEICGYDDFNIFKE